MELSILFHSTILMFVQIMIPATIALINRGIPWGMSNREEHSEVSALHGRALRARDNMAEGFIIFTALIFVAHSLNISNEQTILGAQLFFWGRIGHVVSYVAGITVVRTLAWAISLVGLVMIALEILPQL